MTDTSVQRAFHGPVHVQKSLKHYDGVGMTDDIPDVPAMAGQICEDLEKEKTRGTMFYVRDKPIVIQLPNHGESCYATDEDRFIAIVCWLM